MDFQVIKNAVAAQIQRMQQHQLFRTGVDKELLYSTYLSAFPKGTNLLHRERTEHDCSCCKGFIRTMGDVVALIDNKMVSIWDIDVEDQEPGYQVVANALSALAKSKPIQDVFLHFESKVGADKTFEHIVNTPAKIGFTLSPVKEWSHFFTNLDPKFVRREHDIPALLAVPRDTAGVFLRSLSEITTDAIDTVLELIAEDSLYRGAEHKRVVVEFSKLRKAALTTPNLDFFGWVTATAPHDVAVLRMRTTSIGTLLVDLSKGVDLEEAVRMFESKVAPTNYKRPSAVVSKAMIENAKAKLEELGLTSALQRRYATIDDITINNILFANRSVRTKLSGDVFDELLTNTPATPRSTSKIEEVPIDRFIKEVLPKVDSIELLFESKHVADSNLVSLVAPADPTARPLFKWDNNFSWSYMGEMADSMKAKVKKAGGAIEGDLCCRLAWDYADDLDFHMYEPNFHMYEPNAGHINFSNRGRKSPNGGVLDVDANGIDGQRPDPVENIVYTSKSTMREGVYNLRVHNYNRRSSGVGFEIEVEFGGEIHTFVYDKVVRGQQTIDVARISYSKSNGFSIQSELASTKKSKVVWGIPTEQFHKVQVAMFSPNYWDDQDDFNNGNKHYFFMLEGCTSDSPARSFYNENLRGELNEHRKVMEVVGSKTKLPDAGYQLSGLGFSTTQKHELIFKVSGSFNRTLKVVI